MPKLLDRNYCLDLETRWQRLARGNTPMTLSQIKVKPDRSLEVKSRDGCNKRTSTDFWILACHNRLTYQI